MLRTGGHLKGSWFTELHDNRTVRYSRSVTAVIDQSPKMMICTYYSNTDSILRISVDRNFQSSAPTSPGISPTGLYHWGLFVCELSSSSHTAKHCNIVLLQGTISRYKNALPSVEEIAVIFAQKNRRSLILYLRCRRAHLSSGQPHRAGSKAGGLAPKDAPKPKRPGTIPGTNSRGSLGALLRPARSSPAGLSA